MLGFAVLPSHCEESLSKPSASAIISLPSKQGRKKKRLPVLDCKSLSGMFTD
jgi:hypothetical protein